MFCMISTVAFCGDPHVVVVVVEVTVLVSETVLVLVLGMLDYSGML